MCSLVNDIEPNLCYYYMFWYSQKLLRFSIIYFNVLIFLLGMQSFLELLHDNSCSACHWQNLRVWTRRWRFSFTWPMVFISRGGPHVLLAQCFFMDIGLWVCERSLEFKLFECHNLAATYNLVAWGQARPLGNDFVLGVLTQRVPRAMFLFWCLFSKVTSLQLLQENDGCQELCSRYEMLLLFCVCMCRVLLGYVRYFFVPMLLGLYVRIKPRYTTVAPQQHTPCDPSILLWLYQSNGVRCA